MVAAGRRARVTFMLLVAAAFLVPVASTDAAEPLPGVAVRVSPDAGNQVEPSIAVNPTNARNLVAGYIDSARCGVAWSFDGGLTWDTDILAESTDAPPPGLTPFGNAGDPVIEFTSDGTAYYLCMNTANGNAQKTQYVYRSTNGGADWNDNNPALAIAPAYGDHDKGHIVADNNPASPFFGNVYVAATALPGTAGNGEVLLARSTDGGMTFSTPSQVNDADIGFAVNLAVGADGDVYAAWSVEQAGAQGTSVALRIDRSDDGGANFGTDVEFQSTGIPLSGDVRAELNRGNGFPYIATHPTDPNIVYAVWAEDGTGADDSDIRFSRSTTRGATWSPSIRVNADVNPPSDYSSQFWPTMAVDPVDGDINIIWYSDQNDPDRTDGTPQIDLYFTRSSDDGLMFDEPVRVTQSRSTPPPVPGFFGDYLGIDALGGVAYPIWVDTTLGSTFDAATTQIGPADVAIAKKDTPDPAVAGESVTYELTISNLGPAEARDIVVTDVLPPGTTLISSEATCALGAGGSVTCTLSDPLPAGASTDIPLTVLIAPSLVHDAGGAVTLNNSANATSSQPDPSTANNSAIESTTVAAKTDLAVTSLAVAGETIDPLVGSVTTRDLTATLSNGGPSGPVDVDVAFTATTATGVSVSIAPSTTTAPDLDVGETRDVETTATITCNAPGSHTVTFEVAVTPADPATTDPNVGDNTAEQTVLVDCIVPVAINIKPGSATNPINTKSKGAIPVALLTTAPGEYGLPLAFDATTADVDSIRFGPLDSLQIGQGAPEKHGKGHPKDSLELDEVTRDGDIDLVLHFRVQDAAIARGTQQLCVQGTFVSAGSTYRFVGCDDVQLKP